MTTVRGVVIVGSENDCGASPPRALSAHGAGPCHPPYPAPSSWRRSPHATPCHTRPSIRCGTAPFQEDPSAQLSGGRCRFPWPRGPTRRARHAIASIFRLKHGPATEQRPLHDIAIRKSTVDWILHTCAIRALAVPAIPNVFEILRNGQGRCWFVGRLILERTVHWWRGWGWRQPKRAILRMVLREVEKVAKKLCDQCAVSWRHNGFVGTDAVATPASGPMTESQMTTASLSACTTFKIAAARSTLLRCGAQRSRLQLLLAVVPDNEDVARGSPAATVRILTGRLLACRPPHPSDGCSGGPNSLLEMRHSGVKLVCAAASRRNRTREATPSGSETS